jgi:phosphoribosyl 1,2-cyclic phosphate phosphodiesterase
LKRLFTFLGTGTSQGVPVIGCQCAVCISKDPRDNRLRTAAMVSINDKNIVIDTGPDFRQQMLRARVENIEAVLFTHEHNDHIAGLDDVRPINFRHNKHIPLYATPSVRKALEQRFEYAISENPYPGAPRLEFYDISKTEPFEIEGQMVQPIEVSHGKDLTVLGFRFDDLTYITDCKSIDNTELKKVMGSRILILNALHHNAHHSHLNLTEAFVLIKKIEPEKTYLTHISHNMGLFETVNKTLPFGVELGWDGLSFEF